MSRTILTTITPFDYKDLKQSYSEKNIINQTSGNEYVIDLASTKVIKDINDKSTDVSIAPLGGGKYVDGWSYSEGCVRGIFAKQYIQARDEWYYSYFSLSIETDEIITDVNGVSAGMTLYYDKYYSNGDYVDGNNMSSYLSVYKQIMTDGNKQNNDGLLVASEKLPYEHSVLEYRPIAFIDTGLNKRHETIGGFPANKLTIKCQKLANDHFKITITGYVCTWWGYNYSKADKWGQRGNHATLLAVKKIGLTISANTVQSREIEFNYARDDEKNYGNAKGKNYEIESNEFMQTDENQGSTTRQSYKTSKKIFDAYSQDRTIVSFTLLNCEKYKIGTELRYIQAEDLIYIQDENQQLISDDVNASGNLTPSVFEVIKARPYWEGTFMIDIICRKIDTSSTQ